MFDLDQEIEELARRVIGAAIAVHRALGPGFLESVYQHALSVELNHLGIAHQLEAPVGVDYRGVRVGTGKIDVLVEKTIVLELKTVEAIADIHRAQLISYLKATDLHLGYIFNFNSPVLKDGIQRIIH